MWRYLKQIFTLQNIPESICFTSDSSKITCILVHVPLSPQFLNHSRVFLINCFGRVLESLSEILPLSGPLSQTITCISSAATFPRSIPLPPEQHAFRCTRQQLADPIHTDISNDAKSPNQSFAHTHSPNHHQSEQIHTFFSLPFLSDSCWFNSLSTHRLYSLMCQQLSTPATRLSQVSGARGSPDESSALLPFLLPWPASHLRFLQNIASSFHAAHSQHPHISVPFYSYFFPLFFSLLLSSCVSGVSLGKILNLKGLLNNLVQPCTREIKPFCTFSIYHCVLQSKVLVHTYSLQPFGDWLLHLREVQVNFHFCVWTLCLETWVIFHILNTNGSKWIRVSLHACQGDLPDKQNSHQVKT